MIGADRVLQPLREQHAAIERLDTYASAEDLADALASVHSALDRSLRLLLRADPDAPEDARMAALAPDRLSLDDVVTTLRRRDRISMELAGRMHGLDQAVRRIGGGAEPRPDDADTAEAAVRLLRAEVGAHTMQPGPAGGAPVARPAADAEPLEEAGFEAEAQGRSFGPLIVVGLGVLVLAAVLLSVVRSRGEAEERAAAIGAFDAGDLMTARRGFEAIVGTDSVDVTALLYLARIHRREGRYEAAAAALQAATRRGPDDAAVRRELGWLFLELGRAPAAVEQFERARDLNASDPNNWIGLVRALRAAQDPRAEQVLREAPESVRQQFGGRG